MKISVDNNGKQEPWLLLFKNETHNHPTEIEPFGGAAHASAAPSATLLQTAAMCSGPCASPARQTR